MVKFPVQVHMKTNLHFPCGDITEAFILQAISKALMALQEFRSKQQIQYSFYIYIFTYIYIYIYLHTSIYIYINIYGLINRLRMTLWQTRMISVRLLAVFFQPFVYENNLIFTSRMQDHCCYSSEDVCCRNLRKVSEV